MFLFLLLRITRSIFAGSENGLKIFRSVIRKINEFLLQSALRFGTASQYTSTQTAYIILQTDVFDLDLSVSQSLIASAFAFETYNDMVLRFIQETNTKQNIDQKRTIEAVSSQFYETLNREKYEGKRKVCEIHRRREVE